ncbi:MAG: hypothetical protein JSS58_05545 [Proteobacteria bacterium]|nr:hypothetical protein [Pseudomonadota bacterium]
MRKLFTKSNFDIEAFIAGSVESLRSVNATHGQTWRLGQESSWKVDEQTGRIVFGFADGGAVSAPVQVIGIYTTKDGLFQWAWDHAAVSPPLRQSALRIREFARQKHCAELQQQQCACPERRAWEYTALAMVVTEANGAYRAQVGNDMYIFMTFGDITRQI